MTTGGPAGHFSHFSSNSSLRCNKRPNLDSEEKRADTTHQPLTAPGRRRQSVARACRSPSRRRMYWKSRYWCWRPCPHPPGDRRAGCRARGSIAPSRRCPSARQLGPHESRCTHAVVGKATGRAIIALLSQTEECRKFWNWRSDSVGGRKCRRRKAILEFVLYLGERKKILGNNYSLFGSWKIKRVR